MFGVAVSCLVPMYTNSDVMNNLENMSYPYMTQINVTCDTGYSMNLTDPYDSSGTTVCMADGNWSLPTNSCIGEYELVSDRSIHFIQSVISKQTR